MDNRVRNVGPIIIIIIIISLGMNSNLIGASVYRADPLLGYMDTIW